MKSNPHYDDMMTATQAYNAYVNKIRGKYGYLHTNVQLTDEEIKEHRIVKMAYNAYITLFMAYREQYGV